MKDIRYNYMKISRYVAFFVVSIILGHSVYEILSKDVLERLTKANMAFVAPVLTVCVIVFSIVLLYFAVRVRSYGIINRNGIDIYNGDHEIIHTISKEQIRVCKRMKDLKAGWYLVISTDSYVSWAKTNGVLSTKMVNTYMLDVAMDRLEKRRISKQEFDEQKTYILGITKGQYEEIKSLWKED